MYEFTLYLTILERYSSSTTEEKINWLKLSLEQGFIQILDFLKTKDTLLSYFHIEQAYLDACLNSQEIGLNWLLSNFDIDIQAIDTYGRNALILAIEARRIYPEKAAAGLRIIEKLIEKGINIEYARQRTQLDIKYQFTALLLAGFNLDVAVIKTLILHDANTSPHQTEHHHDLFDEIESFNPILRLTEEEKNLRRQEIYSFLGRKF